jgi:hypothetical protein
VENHFNNQQTKHDVRLGSDGVSARAIAWGPGASVPARFVWSADGPPVRALSRSEANFATGREGGEGGLVAVRAFIHCWKISIAWVVVCLAVGLYFQLWGI